MAVAGFGMTIARLPFVKSIKQGVILKVFKTFSLVVSFVMLFSTAIVSKEKSVGVEVSERGYAFKMEFETSLSVKKTLAILYDIEHLKEYLKESMESRLLDSDSSSYDVEFKYKRLFYSYNAEYKRVIDNSANRVDIKMIRFDQTPKSLPKVIKSSGSYMVNKSLTGQTKITYVQSVCLNEDVGWIFSKVVNSSLNRFADRITEYFEYVEKSDQNKDNSFAYRK